MKAQQETDDEKKLGVNRKAFFNFFVENTLECGIALVGTEVKSIRMHHFNFADAYAEIRSGELWLLSFQITPYSHGNLNNHEALRPRRLLAKKAEIEKLRKKSEERGYTLIPISLYLKNGRVKVEIGLCKGKKMYDKRASIKGRELDREAAREMRE